MQAIDHHRMLTTPESTIVCNMRMIRREVRVIVRQGLAFLRLSITLALEGIVMNHKKLSRLYREEGLRSRCC